MDLDAESGDAVRRRLEEAIEAREDGEPELSAEILRALHAQAPEDALVCLEYALTLRKLGRGAAADAVLSAAVQLHPGDYELRKAWWLIPGIEVDYAGTLARGRALRAAFDPEKFPASWESLAVELDCFYEMGAWEELGEAVARYWEDIVAQPEIFPHGVAALQKLFLNDELARLIEAARPPAWGRLPAGAEAALRTRCEVARDNAAILRAAGASVISIGQNCLPYQLAGRWGLQGSRAEAADLTPFDLGGFTNDSVAEAIATDFAAFSERANFTVTRAWGGGAMYLHRPSQVGFFHERGTHWVTPDGGRFFSRLALMIVNWQRRMRAQKRLFVFCYCGAGDVGKLVAVAAERLLGPGAHLLVVNVLAAPAQVPAHPRVTYLHAPYPPDYDWSSVFQQVSERGLAFERRIAAAMVECLGRLDEGAVAARAVPPPPGPVAGPVVGPGLSRADLLGAVWSFGNRNGNVLAPAFGFGADGTIEFYQNSNEARWTFEDGVLKIFQEGGALMWRSRDVFIDSAGRRHVVMTTPFDPHLEFLLAEIGPREAPAAKVPRYGGRMRVLLLDGGLGIAARLKSSLAGAEIVPIDHVGQVEAHPDANVFISGLALSHIGDAGAAAALIARLTARFSLTVFFEISAHESGYLQRFGLQSFHRGFADNAGMDALNIGFFADAALPANVYKVDHFADQPAFDSFKPFVVSREAYRAGTMPTREARGEYRVFQRPVFEIAAFACHRFESLDPPLADDLTLLETRTLKFRAQSAGVGLEHAQPPGALGRMLYTTERDADEALKGLPVTAPAILRNEAVYGAPAHAGPVNDWMGRFAHERVEVGVFALGNCLVSGVGAVFADGVFVAGTDYLLIYLCSSRLDPIFEGMQRRHRRLHVAGTAILGFNGLYDNYYHWVGEAMTSMSLSLDLVPPRAGETVTLVTGRLNGFRRQYLDILLKDRPDVEIVELDRSEFITAEELIYCDNLGPTKPQNIVVERVAFVEKMLRNAGVADVAGGRRIYLARTDTAGRRVVNEGELIARMRDLGFEIYVASGQDVAAQMAVFRSAAMVVAPHGAGLTNLMFVRPGTVVLELVQANYLNTGMMRLAQTAGARYFSEMFFEEGDEVQSWVVDVERVVASVEILLGGLG